MLAYHVKMEMRRTRLNGRDGAGQEEPVTYRRSVFAGCQSKGEKRLAKAKKTGEGKRKGSGRTGWSREGDVRKVKYLLRR